MLLKNQWVNEEIKEEIRKYLLTSENKNNFPKSMGLSKSCSKREVYSNTGLHQETKKASNKQPNLPSKGIRKRITNKAQTQQKEGNNKDRSKNK